MKVFAIRHADAVEEGPRLADEHRFLSPEGRRSARAVGTRLRSERVSLDWVLTSPLVRAVQTAELVAHAMDHVGPLEAVPSLSPGVHPRIVLEELARRQGAIALVGHEPMLSALCALLVQRPSFPPLRKAQVALIEDGRPAWTLNPESMAIEPLLVA